MDAIFGARNTSLSGNSGNSPIVTGGVGLPAGRVFADGWVAAAVINLRAGIGGYGAARTVNLQLDNVVGTGNFTIGATGASPDMTGYIGTGVGFVNGGATNFRVNTQGRIYFSRGGGGSTSDSAGTNFAGQMYGGYQWFLPPTAPDVPAMSSPVTGQLNLSFSFNGDQGGMGVSGYLIQVADNANFQNPQERLVTTGGPHNFSGLTPGKVYYGRVTARNQVTDWAGRQGGAYSGVASVRVLSGVRIATDSGTLKDSSVFVERNGVLVPAALYWAADSTHLYGLK